MKTELVKQVRLTPNQRISLMSAAANGGQFTITPDWAVREALKYLGLIELRNKYTDAQRRAVQEKTAALWKQASDAVKQRNARALDRAASDIRSVEHDLQSKAWFLTDAAQEYLAVGRCEIIAGKASAARKTGSGDARRDKGE